MFCALGTNEFYVGSFRFSCLGIQFKGLDLKIENNSMGRSYLNMSCYILPNVVEIIEIILQNSKLSLIDYLSCVL